MIHSARLKIKLISQYDRMIVEECMRAFPMIARHRGVGSLGGSGVNSSKPPALKAARMTFSSDKSLTSGRTKYSKQRRRLNRLKQFKQSVSPMKQSVKQ